MSSAGAGAGGSHDRPPGGIESVRWSISSSSHEGLWTTFIDVTRRGAARSYNCSPSDAATSDREDPYGADPMKIAAAPDVGHAQTCTASTPLLDASSGRLRRLGS
jgi:hypothetical protein